MESRWAARVAWASVGLAAALAAAVVALGLARGGSVQGLPPFRVTDALVRVALVGFPLAAALIAPRHPRNPVWMVLAGLTLPGMVNAVALEYAARALVIDPGCCPGGEAAAWVGTWAYNAASGLPALLLLLFPTGRLPTRRLRWAAWAVPLSAALGFVAFAFSPGPVEPGWPMHNPLGQHAAAPILEPMSWAAQALAAVAILSGVGAMVWRYRHAAHDERAQLRWFTLAAALVPVSIGAYVTYFVVLNGSDPLVSTLIGALNAGSVAAIPAAVGVAVLKYRLYDVDLVVNRVVVYGALAGFVTTVYVVVVAGAGLLLQGDVEERFAVSILATAVVAIAFQPVRERVQGAANRLVYGPRSTPYEVLASLTRLLADTGSTAEMLTRMAQVVADSTGAVRVGVWLATDGQLRAVACWPQDDTDAEPADIGEPLRIPACDFAVPIRHQQELLGALALTGRPGEALRPIERRLLTDLSLQAGLLLRNARLDAELHIHLEELAASRRRLVLAQDAERRRLERDLHDGVQQQLTAALAKLRLARNQVGTDPQAADALLDELTVELRQTAKEMRELAHGIRPRLLADHGLVRAVGARVDRMEVPITLHADPAATRSRYAEEVEAAAYYFVCEALANVLKHAAATHVEIRLAEHDRQLTVRVVDDGAGFDPSVTPLSGLRGLRDRIEAVGGRLEVRSRPLHGTELVATLPARKVAS